MGWEFRKGKPYYYHKERIDGKVVSQYCGPAGGPSADLWASLAALDRERRQQHSLERAIERQRFAELASTPAELTALLAEASRATAQALEAAGYQQHKRGEWRKRRARSEEEDQGQSTAS